MCMSNLSVELLHIPVDLLAAPIPSYLFEEELSLVAGPTAVDNGAKLSSCGTLLNVSSTPKKEDLTDFLSVGIVFSTISQGMCAHFSGSLSTLVNLPNSRSTQSSSWKNSFGRSLACKVVDQQAQTGAKPDPVWELTSRTASTNRLIISIRPKAPATIPNISAPDIMERREAETE